MISPERRSLGTTFPAHNPSVKVVKTLSFLLWREHHCSFTVSEGNKLRIRPGKKSSGYATTWQPCLFIIIALLS